MLGHEGGYVNDPRDPGGETNWGISKRSYPAVNIKALTKEAAQVIYLRDFWKPLGNAHAAVKYQVFDFAVNGGLPTGLRKLQAAVGVADDGHWGPVSAKALAALDVNDVLLRFNAQRLRYYASLSNWPVYGKGWTVRVAGNLDFAAMDN
ncbi:glycoside hydrolase family 108 protein [Polaromonas hydrogenivorans]|uniref:glycoside hydrolase family 108 protein n=1 Tax=Polaromonas hydrogenivorans TaxID=335476 RepID=UPI0039F00744